MLPASSLEERNAVRAAPRTAEAASGLQALPSVPVTLAGFKLFFAIINCNHFSESCVSLNRRVVLGTPTQRV